MSAGIVGRPLLGEGVEQFLNKAADQRVYYREIGREREHREDHDSGGGANLFPTGPGDALHFELELFEIIFGSSRPSGGPVCDALLFSHFTFPASKKFRTGRPGRGRGIRTPKGGFGDRWFTV